MEIKKELLEKYNAPPDNSNNYNGEHDNNGNFVNVPVNFFTYASLIVIHKHSPFLLWLYYTMFILILSISGLG